MNWPQPKERRKPPFFGRSISCTFLILGPELLVPLAVFLSRYLSISGCGIEAGVAEVLLKHSEAVAGIVMFHGIHGEGVT